MKLRNKILLGLAVGIVSIIAVFVVIIFLGFRMEFGEAAAFRPDCGQDFACRAWAEFRTAHPYPYQALAAKHLSDGTLALILSEPPPVTSKRDLHELLEKTFGSDLLAYQARRWQVLADGWIEDVVVRVRVNGKNPASTTQDALFRDRLAVITERFFGTTYGGAVDFFTETPPDSRPGVPNVRISPSELRRWVTGKNVKWQQIGSDVRSDKTWADLVHDQSSGAFASSDGNLVLLAFPTRLVLDARANPSILGSLRVPFRMFAVANDSVLGGLWNTDGQCAIVARARSQSLTAVPPLRFETFALLATQYDDELSQSYERNAIFAGKLDTGEYAFKDWAPILLSDSLIDTEFGALLDTTDQILKSWSEAGTVKYQFFNYVKPAAFPFGRQKLSEVLAKETGATTVTFNWNTKGFGTVVARPDMSVIAAAQIGALPVTYLAGEKSGSEKDTIRTHEDEAYSYFASQRDPNLERVVQYTSLYQLFRAIEKGTSSAALLPAASKAGVSPRLAAHKVLSDEAERLLKNLQAGSTKKSNQALVTDVKSRLNAFRAEHSRIDNAALARILADRFSDDAKKYQAGRQAQILNIRQKLNRDASALESDVALYNLGIKSSYSNQGMSLRHDKAELERRKQGIERRFEAYDQMIRNDPVEKLRDDLAEIAVQEYDLETVRAQYVSKIPPGSEGAFKTPSIVISWAGKDVLRSVGGHNLDARTLRLEMRSDITNVELTETSEGYVLRYNPGKADAVEANAAALAHAIEHDEIQASQLDSVIGKAAELRDARSALSLPEPTGDANRAWERWSGQLGTRTYYGKDIYVEDLRKVAETNDCCIFVGHDNAGVSYVTEKNLTPPPSVSTLEVRDTPSLRDYIDTVALRREGHQKTLIFFDSTEDHVEALTLGLRERASRLEGAHNFDLAVSKSAVGNVNGSRRVDALLGRDLRGRPSFIETVSDFVGSRSRSVLENLGVIKPGEAWRTINVEEMDSPSIQKLLEHANWEPARDGVPTAIKVSFRPGGPDALPDLSVIAGFEQSGNTIGTARLKAVHRQNVLAAGQQGASVAEYLMGVKNDVLNLKEAQLKRLLMVVQDPKEKEIFFSRLEPKDAARSAILRISN